MPAPQPWAAPGPTDFGPASGNVPPGGSLPPGGSVPGQPAPPPWVPQPGPYGPAGVLPPPRRPRKGLKVAVVAGAAAVLLLVGLGVIAAVKIGQSFRPDPRPHATADRPAVGSFTDGGSLTTSLGSQTAGIMPSDATGPEAYSLTHALFTGLVRYDPKTGAAVNALAEQISTSDQKTWTISIHKGSTFDNGEPVDAEAFIRSWSYAAYGPNATATGFDFDRIDGYQQLQGSSPKSRKLRGLTAVDDYTLKVTLTQPYGWFRYQLGEPAFAPMAAACERDLTACKAKPIGNGPFSVRDSWHEGGDLTLVRSDTYRGRKAHLDTVIMKGVSDPVAAYRAFDQGEIDLLTALHQQQYSQAQDDHRDGLVQRPSLTTYFLGFPLKDKRFNDKRLRQAFSMAIDRKKLASAFGDAGAPLTNFAPAGAVGSPKTGPCANCSLDVQKARAMLDAAGWKKDSAVTLYAPSSVATARQQMELVCRQLATNLGIRCSVSAEGAADYYQKLTAHKMAGPYRLPWISDMPTVAEYVQLFTDEEGDYLGYHNPTVQSGFRAGNAAADPDAASDAYQKSWRHLDDDMPAIPLWQGGNTALTSPDFGGVTLDTQGAVDLAAVSRRG